MLKDRLQGLSGATYVEYGYGQVEPNHLSAQATGQIYAQLPAASTITKLENGQFVKYDYSAGVCDFVGKGEWMLVYNEIKLYREGQLDCEFAMIKENYNARVYSPLDPETVKTIQTRYYGGVGPAPDTVSFEKVTAPNDMYEVHYTENPFANHEIGYKEKKMPVGTTMVPRVFKTNIGDIFTTNTVKEATLAVGNELVVGDDGYLTKTAGSNAGTMKWEVVKVYTMPDGQKGVKIMRIA